MPRHNLRRLSGSQPIGSSNGGTFMTSYRIEAVLALAGLFAAPSLYAGEVPTVEFTADYLVACRDVTPKEYALKNKNKKLIEAAVRASAKLKNGKEADLDGLTL